MWFDFEIRAFIFQLISGAVVTSQFTYSFLELKHIQLDTLGHLVCNHALTAGDFAGATRIYGTTLKFFTTNYKDVIKFES